MKKNYDFVIIGAGIIGLTLARAITKRRLGTVCLLEKEQEVGHHSSGRNSGVLHAGIYYGSDSLKAKVCARGSQMLQEYASQKGIACRKTGKVIVATSASTDPQIDVLYKRGKANGISVEKITADELKKIEPEAVTYDTALYSPDTVVIDGKAVLRSLAEEMAELGVEFMRGVEVIEVKEGRSVVGSRGEELGFGHLINCAGLYADKVAHSMGVGEAYRILPFKGIYRKIHPRKAPAFKGSIYPAPDLSVPFLGVHITRNIDDEVMVGPTAIPAFGRENYGIFEGLDLKETPAMFSDLLRMLLENRDGFRKMVFEELAKYRSKGFFECSRALAPSLQPGDILSSGKIGIRAQLMNVKTRRLVMDFVLEEGPCSTHILNAVSPAFTSSLAFAELILDGLEKRLGN